MKTFTTLKIGYSVGIYGCSGEYFTTIIHNGKKIYSVSHNGLYGSEERINALLRDNGYVEEYIQSFYGKLTRKDITKNMLSEYEAIAKLKKDLKLKDIKA